MQQVKHQDQVIINRSVDHVGYRIDEFRQMIGISRPTVARMLRDGHVKTVKVGTVRLIPRSEMIRLGLIDARQ